MALTGYLNLRKVRKTQTTSHHGDTVITGVTSGRLTGGKISSPSQPYLLCRVRKFSILYQKYLNLCSEDEQRSYGFGMTWVWVINDIIYIFIPLTATVWSIVMEIINARNGKHWNVSNNRTCKLSWLTMFLGVIQVFFLLHIWIHHCKLWKVNT